MKSEEQQPAWEERSRDTHAAGSFCFSRSTAPDNVILMSESPIPGDVSSTPLTASQPKRGNDVNYILGRSRRQENALLCDSSLCWLCHWEALEWAPAAWLPGVGLGGSQHIYLPCGSHHRLHSDAHPWFPTSENNHWRWAWITSGGKTTCRFVLKEQSRLDGMQEKPLL